MDIYLMKPVLFPKNIWESLDKGDDVRYLGNDTKKLLKDFIYEKGQIHTLESMAHHVRLSVDDFVKFIDHLEYGRKSNEYPFVETFRYIKSEEIGYCDGYGIKESYCAILGGRKISSREVLNYLSKDMFRSTEHTSIEKWQQWFTEGIMNKFIDGETFVEFS